MSKELVRQDRFAMIIFAWKAWQISGRVFSWLKSRKMVVATQSVALALLLWGAGWMVHFYVTGCDKGRNFFLWLFDWELDCPYIRWAAFLKIIFFSIMVTMIMTLSFNYLKGEK